jgi:hypothetical protein
MNAAAQRGEKWVLVVDNVEEKEHEGVVKGSNLVFDSLRELHAFVNRSNESFRMEVEN